MNNINPFNSECDENTFDMYPHVTFFKMCEILSAARNFRRYIENTKGIRDFNNINAKIGWIKSKNAPAIEKI